MYNILIIDKGDFLVKLRSIVENSPFAFSSFDNVENAIEEMQNKEYPMIFIDIEIANSSPVFWKMRKKYAKSSVVILTVDIKKFEDTLFPVKKDVTDIIIKPYRQDTILNTLNFFGEKYSFIVLKDSISKNLKSQFTLKINSDKKYISYISKYINNFLHVNFIKGLVSFKIAFEEALTNAIVHGNKEDRRKKISIKANIYPKKVVVSIEDQGDGFDFSKAMIGLTESQTNIFNTHGRGILMISVYTDSFHYEKDGKKIVLVKHINKKAQYK